jgi:hypothetical protein
MNEEADQASLSELPLSPWQLWGTGLTLTGYFVFWMLLTGFSGDNGDGIPFPAFAALLLVMLGAPTVGAGMLAASLTRPVMDGGAGDNRASGRRRGLVVLVPMVVFAATFAVSLSTGIIWG